MQATYALGPNVGNGPAAAQFHSDSEYAVLKERIKAEGLLERKPFFYVFQALIVGGLALLCVVLLLAATDLWFRLLIAPVMAFTSAQLGFIGHDLGHRQVFRRSFHNDLVMVIASPLAGIVPSWWMDTHNRHHSTPNDLKRDPHTTIPVLAFSEEQARVKRGVYRVLIKHQALYFLPLLCLSVISTKMNGVIYLAKGHARYPFSEALGVSLHVVLYCALLILTMPVVDALLVAAFHHGLLGLYFGLMFAPNHKGMPTFSEEHWPDFLRSQVLTSRNIRPSPVVDFLYGGLNFQIEHHLFPNLPRNRLKAARTIVRSFCMEREIPYHETSVVKSYSEVLRHLQKVAA